MKTTKIAVKLEHELLAAVVRGACSPSVVSVKELSKIGRIIHNALVQLSQNGLQAPFKLTTIFTHCISNLGAPEEDTRQFLRNIQSVCKLKDTDVLVKIAKEKEALVNIMNEASQQLAGGKTELRKFQDLIEAQKDNNEKPKTLFEVHKDYDGEPVHGLCIDSLPTISDVTYGLQGIWVIGGEPGVGKSTLGLQIAIEAQQNMPVLYYDVDGTGERWMIYRVCQAVGKENFENATNKLFYFSSIANLDNTLLSCQPPSLVVIDSIQALPTSVLHRRSSLDKWISDFKSIANRGYTVLLISEMNRAAYGQDPRMGAYKESGEIEYAGGMCAQLHAISEDMMEFHIVKNRHGPKKGHVATLQRDQQYPFWLEEI
jgi:hypothetical protein